MRNTGIQQICDAPSAPLQNQRASKSLARLYAKYYESPWVADGAKAIVNEEDRMGACRKARRLREKLRDFQKAKKPDAAKVAEVQRLLAILLVDETGSSCEA